jgi:hypothetical protein
VESAAYWILEQLGEEGAVIDELNEFIQGLAGRQVTEDDLATFLGYAGFVEEPTEAARIPTGNAVSEALATLIRNGLSTQGELQERVSTASRISPNPNTSSGRLASVSWRVSCASGWLAASRFSTGDVDPREEEQF